VDRCVAKRGSFVPGADPTTGQSLSGGEKIPGGDKSFVPGGVGILFSIEGKDPQRDGTPGTPLHTRWDNFANENLSRLNASC